MPADMHVAFVLYAYLWISSHAHTQKHTHKYELRGNRKKLQEQARGTKNAYLPVTFPKKLIKIKREYFCWTSWRASCRQNSERIPSSFWPTAEFLLWACSHHCTVRLCVPPPLSLSLAHTRTISLSACRFASRYTSLFRIKKNKLFMFIH